MGALLPAGHMRAWPRKPGLIESQFGTELLEPQGSLRPGFASWSRGRWEGGGTRGCWAGMGRGGQAFFPCFIQSMSASSPPFSPFFGGRVYVNLFFYIELPYKICFRQTASEIHICRIQGDRDRASVGLQLAQVGRMGQPAVSLPIAPVWAALSIRAVTWMEGPWPCPPCPGICTH